MASFCLGEKVLNSIAVHRLSAGKRRKQCLRSRLAVRIAAVLIERRQRLQSVKKVDLHAAALVPLDRGHRKQIQLRHLCRRGQLFAQQETHRIVGAANARRSSPARTIAMGSS